MQSTALVSIANMLCVGIAHNNVMRATLFTMPHIYNTAIQQKLLMLYATMMEFSVNIKTVRSN
jgi:hypothetical protein